MASLDLSNFISNILLIVLSAVSVIQLVVAWVSYPHKKSNSRLTALEDTQINQGNMINQLQTTVNSVAEDVTKIKENHLAHLNAKMDEVKDQLGDLTAWFAAVKESISWIRDKFNEKR